MCRRSATILSSLLEEPAGQTSARGTSVKLPVLNSASHCRRQKSAGNHEDGFSASLDHFTVIYGVLKHYTWLAEILTNLVSIWGCDR